MNEQQETFNQQQYYYKNITGKSKANNFCFYKCLDLSISFASASSNNLANNVFNSASNCSLRVGLASINALYSARNSLDFSRYSLNGDIIYYSFYIVNKFLRGLI